MQKAFNKPLEQIFMSFDEKPVASGCIGMNLLFIYLFTNMLLALLPFHLLFQLKFIGHI